MRRNTVRVWRAALVASGSSSWGQRHPHSRSSSAQYRSLGVSQAAALAPHTRCTWHLPLHVCSTAPPPAPEMAHAARWLAFPECHLEWPIP